MTNRNRDSIHFPRCKGRLVEASFSGGALLPRQADRLLGLTERAARAVDDPRRKASCRHTTLSMIRQRVYGLALGHEDLNDHEELRWDPALQTAVGSDRVLAGGSFRAPVKARKSRIPCPIRLLVQYPG